MLRQTLNNLYDAAGVLAALSMVATLVMILISIFGRLLNFYLPGTDAYAGYCTAASGFLALAHTLRRGEHIRVTLFLLRLPTGTQKWLQFLVHLIGLFFTGIFAYYSIRLVLMSRELGDISTSNDATPLWIPQCAMALGAVILVIAVLHGLVDVLAGRGATETPNAGAEPAHVE
jgi:TRAP-type C4-dicarboxylate transport system permease small subunit